MALAVEIEVAMQGKLPETRKSDCANYYSADQIDVVAQSRNRERISDL
jgi:hypothetical protein